MDTFKVVELKAELKKRACSMKGNRAVLVARLKEAIEKNLPLVATLEPEEADILAGEGFALGAKWELSTPNDDIVDNENDRVIEGQRFREPTVGVDEYIDGLPTARKRNYGLELIGLHLF